MCESCRFRAQTCQPSLCNRVWSMLLNNLILVNAVTLALIYVNNTFINKRRSLFISSH